jgi:cysteinyl-tRNA synthetase
MTLKLYNTLTRKKELFKPIKNKQVSMYTCGPTVYDYAHIGNFRAYMCSDILKRYLRYKGYRVKHAMNITDVEDKTIKGAIKEHISLKKYTKKFENAFFEDLEKLNIDKANIFPRATDHINEMMDIIGNLLKKKIAYKAKDGIYFDISKFKDYGKLSGVELKNLEIGERIRKDQYEKDEAHDFALWKFWDKNDYDVFWETEIGKGRPGWHIECSAMSMKFLGKSFDIHAGGIDLIFPHHENEIAQSEGSTRKKFVNYWFHNEHLLVDGQKMSKSLGNFYTLRDLLDKGYDSRSIRYLLLSSHYRQQLNFTEGGIKAAKNSIDRLNDFMIKLKTMKIKKNNPKIKKLILETKKDFEKEMDDDLQISNALAVIFDFVKKINTLIMNAKIGKGDAGNVYNLMLEFDNVLGVLDVKKEKIPEEIKKLVKAREKSRKEKNYEKADKIREEIKNKRYILEDTEKGTVVKKQN